MTQDLLTDLGEEYLIKNGLVTTATVGVYNDGSHSAGDNLSDGSDIGDVTTEPGNANYSRQSVTLSAADLSGNWGVDNDAQFTFDFSDVSTEQWVDTFFVIINFQASDTGDGGANDHLIANPAMTTDRDIGSVDYIDVNAGDISISLD